MSAAGGPTVAVPGHPVDATVTVLRRVRWHLMSCLAMVAMTGLAFAGEPRPAAASGAAVAGTGSPAAVSAADLGVAEWLMRMHEAPRRRAYIGTFVVSAGTLMSSAKIWHSCDGSQQMQRVEPLSGPPRSTIRRNDQVVTLLPETKTAVIERRESIGLFPDLLKSTSLPIAQYYSARHTGSERVAGLEADVVLLQPKDDLRYGYRVWSEKRTGLVVKLQTLDRDGKVLEQAAFSELQLDAPVSQAKLGQMMDNLEGYRVERPQIVRTSAATEGWTLRSPIAGFSPMNCFLRPGVAIDGSVAEPTMQWVFSDGLATVSIFLEPFDRRRHGVEGFSGSGATNTLSRKMADKGAEWALTLVGEVPRQTLNAFAASLERRR